MKQKTKRAQKGFTLPEIIISISVLTMTITAATSIMVSVLRSNTDNLDNLTAYGLAQEGIEVMRNIRDSNWVLGLDFAGETGNSENFAKVWGASLPKNVKSLYFVFEENVSGDCSDAENCAPWKLVALGEAPAFKNDGDFNFASLVGQTKVFKRVASSGEKTLLFYQNEAGIPDNGDQTLKFYRFVKVEALSSYVGGGNAGCDGGICPRYRIFSAVYWKGSNEVVKHVTLTTELTQWKK